jgi:hypothetical protein
MCHHAAKKTGALESVFNERISSRRLWLSYSLDLNMYDLFLWGNCIQKLYILEQMKPIKKIKDQFVKCPT